MSLLAVVVLRTSVASGATSGANGTHDPSRMVESNGKFYVYSTGGGGKSSADGLVWTDGQAIFGGGGIPTSTTSLVPNDQGVWAPDVIYLNGQYYLYYAIANKACAIGLVTSPTLDPTSPDYKWTDRGAVISSSATDTYCTLDPAPVLDAAGNLWLSWGSGYSHASTDKTIFVTRLDNSTGLVSSADSTKPGYSLELGHIEASYIYYHSNYYYLFWNSGGCCGSSGKPNSSISYEIHVARSQTITGPYTEGALFDKGGNGIYGPGQIGIYDKCGASRFTYHYYPTSGGSVLGENELSWSSDGWPVVGAESTTPLKPCGQIGGSVADGGLPPSTEMEGGAASNDGTSGAASLPAGSSGAESGSALPADADAAVGSADAAMSGGPSGALPGNSGSTGGNGGGGGSSAAAAGENMMAMMPPAGSGSAGLSGAADTSGSANEESGTHANSGGCSLATAGAPGWTPVPAGLLLLGVAIGLARRRLAVRTRGEEAA